MLFGVSWASLRASVIAHAPSLRVLVLFEYEHPRTLGQDEPVAVRRKRPRGTLGLIVPGLCERVQQRVSLDDAWGDWGVHATRKKHRLHSGLNMLVGVTDRVA